MGLSTGQLEKRIAELSSLPALPAVVRNIGKMVEDKSVSASDIGDLISKDQALSARLLRMVNSPIYGFPGRISSVTHAVVLLGFNVVKGLVLGTTVFDTFAQRAKGLWEHSLGCAIISRGIAKQRGMADVEEVMVAGLLHDLGKAVLSFVDKDGFRAACKVAQAKNCHIALAEHEIFGVDHARVANWLAREWHLPARLSEPLAYHHRPDLAKHSKDITGLVHLADILTRGMGYGSPGDMTMPPLDHAVFQGLGISYEQIDRVLLQAEMEYSAGADLFAVGE